MAQNIYDRPEFFEGYSGLPRSVHGLDGAPEWPSVRRLVPDLTDLRVVDLGCGFGWFCRWAAARGAARVLGLDLSQKMIGRAGTETDRAGTGSAAIEYRIADLDRLDLDDAAFDFAYSALAFHYVADFRRLVGTVHAALVPGAWLVFTIEHPIFMASMAPGWIEAPNGRRSWPVDHYAIEGERRTDWFAKGVIKHHRRLSTTLNTLIEAGFAIRHVDEWAPTDAQLADNPDLADECERPMMAIVAAQR